MSKRIGIEAAFIGVFGLLIIPRIALAETGTYEAVYSFLANYASFEHGSGTVTGGSNRGATTITDSSGGLFVKGQSSAQECVILAKKSSAGINLDADCTATDVPATRFHHANPQDRRHDLAMALERTRSSVAPGNTRE
jgi:hypothetical protein